MGIVSTQEGGERFEIPSGLEVAWPTSWFGASEFVGRPCRCGHRAWDGTFIAHGWPLGSFAFAGGSDAKGVAADIDFPATETSTAVQGKLALAGDGPAGIVVSSANHFR